METSFIDEFKRSWLTSLIGLAFCFGGVWLLTWNEGRAVHHAHSLEEAYNNVIALNPYDRIRPELNGQLVHISGPLLIDEPLTEPDYGVSIQSVKLKRRVQMYQWVEERTQRDYGDVTSTPNPDNTDYYYVTEWRDKLVDSRSFYIRHGHHNPVEMPLKSYIHLSALVRVGHLTLGTQLKDKFTDYIEVTGDERPERKDIKLHIGIYYHCDDVWKPEVGDIRVQFYYAGLNGETVSIVGMQKQGTIIPYITSKGHEVLLLRHGALSTSQMFSEEHADARLATWKLRAVGVFILYGCSVCLARLLRIIFSRLPFTRRFACDEITSTGNFVISLSVSLIVIATAWIAYRPWVGISLLMAAFSPFLYCTIGIYNVAQGQNAVYNR